MHQKAKVIHARLLTLIFSTLAFELRAWARPIPSPVSPSSSFKLCAVQGKTREDDVCPGLRM